MWWDGGSLAHIAKQKCSTDFQISSPFLSFFLPLYSLLFILYILDCNVPVLFSDCCTCVHLIAIKHFTSYHPSNHVFRLPFFLSKNKHTHTHPTHWPLICEQAESAAPLRVTELYSFSLLFSHQAYNFTVLVHFSHSIFWLQKEWLFFAVKPIKTHNTLWAQPQTADRHN